MPNDDPKEEKWFDDEGNLHVIKGNFKIFSPAPKELCLVICYHNPELLEKIKGVIKEEYGENIILKEDSNEFGGSILQILPKLE